MTIPFLYPFGFAVAIGQVPGMVRASGIGYNPDVDTATAPEDAWGGNGLYPWLTAATSLELVSTSALDAGAGIGARTVTVNGLDASYVPVVQTISLNGLTPVVLPSQLFRINSIRSATAGSTGTNVGDIILRDTGAGTMRGIILAGIGTSRQAPYTVPAGQTLAVPQILLNVNSPTGAVGQFATIATYFKSPTGAAIRPLIIGNTSSQPYNHQSDPPIMIAEKTDFSLPIMSSSDNNTIVTAGWNGYLKTN